MRRHRSPASSQNETENPLPQNGDPHPNHSDCGLLRGYRGRPRADFGGQQIGGQSARVGQVPNVRHSCLEHTGLQ